MKTFRLSYQQYAQALANYAYLENISSSYFIREYNTQHAGSWPSVKSGFIDEKTAILIAERYIHGY